MIQGERLGGHLGIRVSGWVVLGLRHSSSGSRGVGVLRLKPESFAYYDASRFSRLSH